MADDFIRGTKDFQVPGYFNFAHVIDEWAQKEKVNNVWFISIKIVFSRVVYLIIAGTRDESLMFLSSLKYIVQGTYKY